MGGTPPGYESYQRDYHGTMLLGGDVACAEPVSSNWLTRMKTYPFVTYLQDVGIGSWKPSNDTQLKYCLGQMSILTPFVALLQEAPIMSDPDTWRQGTYPIQPYDPVQEMMTTVGTKDYSPTDVINELTKSVLEHGMINLFQPNPSFDWNKPIEPQLKSGVFPYIIPIADDNSMPLFQRFIDALASVNNNADELFNDVQSSMEQQLYKSYGRLLSGFAFARLAPSSSVMKALTQLEQEHNAQVFEFVIKWQLEKRNQDIQLLNAAVGRQLEQQKFAYATLFTANQLAEDLIKAHSGLLREFYSDRINAAMQYLFWDFQLYEGLGKALSAMSGTMSIPERKSELERVLTTAGPIFSMLGSALFLVAQMFL